MMTVYNIYICITVVYVNTKFLGGRSPIRYRREDDGLGIRDVCDRVAWQSWGFGPVGGGLSVCMLLAFFVL
jgi:hypothetical protein